MFILLFRHQVRAGIGVDSSSTCSAGATQLCLPFGPPFTLSVEDLLLCSYRSVQALGMKELFPALEHDRCSLLSI